VSSTFSFFVTKTDYFYCGTNKIFVYVDSWPINQQHCKLFMLATVL